MTEEYGRAMMARGATDGSNPLAIRALATATQTAAAWAAAWGGTGEGSASPALSLTRVVPIGLPSTTRRGVDRAADSRWERECCPLLLSFPPRPIVNGGMR